MTSLVYDQVLTQKVRGYEFVIRDDRSDVRLRMKAINAIPLVDWLDRHILS